MSTDFNIENNNKNIQEFIGGRSFSEIYSDTENEVVRSYVTESKYNKGLFVMIVVCRNGKKYVVSDQTYLKPYEQSFDINPEQTSTH